MSQEATELVSQGEYEEGCDVYMQGIFLGRKVVQSLMEQDSSETDGDDPQLALDWIVESYLACSKARIELGEWNTARSDAWAACSYSENKNLEALVCMLKVCEKDDPMGELRTLKLIDQLISSDEQNMNTGIIDGEEVLRRIQSLEEELERKFNIVKK